MSEDKTINITVISRPSETTPTNDTQAPRASIWCESHYTGYVDRDEDDTIVIEGSSYDNVEVEKITLFYEGVAIDSVYGNKISSTIQTDSLRVGYNEFYFIVEDTSGNAAYSDTLVIDIHEEYKGDYTPQEDEIGVKVGDKYVPFDVPPQIINNRTMIPLRAVSETLGAIVNWNADTRAATIDCNGKVCKVTIGSPIITWEESGAWLNGGKTGSIETDSPAVIVDNRTLVPLRAISEIFGYEVGWDGETRTVSIEK